MILQNIQCSHSGKNFKLSLVYVGIAIFLFYNIQTLLLESSGDTIRIIFRQKLTFFFICLSEKQNIPQPYLQSRQEENIPVGPLVKEDGQNTAKPVASQRNNTDSQHTVWISMGELGE